MSFPLASCDAFVAASALAACVASPAVKFGYVPLGSNCPRLRQFRLSRVRRGDVVPVRVALRGRRVPRRVRRGRGLRICRVRGCVCIRRMICVRCMSCIRCSVCRCSMSRIRCGICRRCVICIRRGVCRRCVICIRRGVCRRCVICIRRVSDFRRTVNDFFRSPRRSPPSLPPAALASRRRSHRA